MIAKKKIKFYNVDAYQDRSQKPAWADASTPSCRRAFFKLANVSFPKPTRSKYMKEAVKKTYGKKGDNDR